MLIYHPLKDANHCTFRMLSILNDIEVGEISFDLLRLLDFYMLFPHLLKDIAPLPQHLSGYKKELKKIKEPYENLPLASKLLFDLYPIQEYCVTSLLAKGIIKEDNFKKVNLIFVRGNLNNEILDLISTSKLKQEVWYKFLIEELPKINFYGTGGLKARTTLMEYRYDAV